MNVVSETIHFGFVPLLRGDAVEFDYTVPFGSNPDSIFRISGDGEECMIRYAVDGAVGDELFTIKS